MSYDFARLDKNIRQRYLYFWAERYQQNKMVGFHHYYAWGEQIPDKRPKGVIDASLENVIDSTYTPFMGCGESGYRYDAFFSIRLPWKGWTKTSTELLAYRWLKCGVMWHE